LTNAIFAATGKASGSRQYRWSLSSNGTEHLKAWRFQGAEGAVFGRLTLEDLRQDLCAVIKKCRLDCDITTPELKVA
jgi:hypothetical protein